MRWKDLESLRVAISQHESSLGWGQPEETTTSDDDSSDHGAGDAAEAEMAITPVADDTPSGSATTQSSDPPPAEEQTHAMEVDDEDGSPLPASPVSPGEDDLLTGGGAVGVEGEMANLGSHLPRTTMLVVRMPPFRRPLLTSSAMSFCEALLANASRMPMKKGRELLPWNIEEDSARWKRLTRSHDPRKTLPQAVRQTYYKAYFA